MPVSIASPVAAVRDERPVAVTLPIEPKHAWYLPWKIALEFAAALVLLLLLSPVIILAAIAVKLTSPGPALYRQTRLGRGGRPFRIIKLRTMVHNAESRTGPVWCQAGDPRVTPLGRLLRATHVDEFPQLINVLLGHMSLVGPRPERPEFVRDLEFRLPGYSDRLNVRPGITGIAQLNLPPDKDLDSVRRKLIHDLYYVRYCSPWLDFQVILFTGWDFIREMALAVWRLIAPPSVKTVNARAVNIVGPDSDLLIDALED
jgi:lipopolysaccharide/colanic/teichoic acid biosynthesis glycosyltransferase